MEKFNDSTRSWQLPHLCREHARWVKTTFGPGRKPWNHLKLEAEELAAHPNDISEMADIFLLLIDTARMAGFGISDLCQAANEKLLINQTREWSPPDANGVCQHITKSPVAH